MLSFSSFGRTITDRKFLVALFAEFVGVGIFQLFGGALPVKTRNDQPNYTDQITAATIALANGLLYSALVYWSQHLSGGHLNPAVTIAVTSSGHLSVVKGLLYIFVQVRFTLFGTPRISGRGWNLWSLISSFLNVWRSLLLR
eukprot:g5909.t1